MRSARSSRRNESHAIYSDPEAYDLAFAYRDINDECDGILEIARRHGVGRPSRAVEFACGPAHHLRELAHRKIGGVGVDASAAMIRYARELCRREGIRVDLRRGDMRTVRLPAGADIALCLFDSFANCITDEDGVATLRSAARALRSGGILLLELAHPADFFDVPGPKRTRTQWTHRRLEGTVRTRFRLTQVDAIEERYVALIDVDVRDRRGSLVRKIRDRRQLRMWLVSGIKDIAHQSGLFDVAAFYGALDPRIALTMKRDVPSMVVALVKRSRKR